MSRALDSFLDINQLTTAEMASNLSLFEWFYIERFFPVTQEAVYRNPLVWNQPSGQEC